MASAAASSSSSSSSGGDQEKFISVLAEPSVPVDSLGYIDTEVCHPCCRPSLASCLPIDVNVLHCLVGCGVFVKLFCWTTSVRRPCSASKSGCTGCSRDAQVYSWRLPCKASTSTSNGLWWQCRTAGAFACFVLGVCIPARVEVGMLFVAALLIVASPHHDSLLWAG